MCPCIMGTRKNSKSNCRSLKCSSQEGVGVSQEDIEKYDVIGFGFGIYYWKHHEILIKFVKICQK